MYASSTAGLFYFMNRNISRDNWTRGAATTKLSAYGAVCLPRAIPYRTDAPHHRIAIASRRGASRSLPRHHCVGRLDASRGCITSISPNNAKDMFERRL